MAKQYNSVCNSWLAQTLRYSIERIKNKSALITEKGAYKINGTLRGSREDQETMVTEEI